MRIPFPKAEYIAAVERETVTRTLAFADAPELVCSIPVRSLTLQDVVVLDGVGSPFIVGGVPSGEDVIIFLWLQSPEFEAGNSRKLKKFTRQHRRLPFGEAVKAISAFIDEAYMDAPKGGGTQSLPYWGWPATLVDLFGHAYGWNEIETLRCPLKRLFQYRKAVLKRINPKTILTNPSMEIRAKWLEEINRN